MASTNSTVEFEVTTTEMHNNFEPQWIAGEILLLIIAFVTVYVFVALMYYSWRFRNMARVSKSVQEMRERYLHYSCAAVILMAIARCCLHQVIVWLPRPMDVDVCRPMMVASRIAYNLAICLTYVYLWLRQRMFYTKEELKPLRNKVIEVVDWAVLLITISSSLVLALVAFIPLDGKTTEMSYNTKVCNVFEYNSKIMVQLYGGLSVTFQLALIALYLYPIINQWIHKRREQENPANAGAGPAHTFYPALWSGIRRGFILTVVIIVSDATTGILVWILTKRYPDHLSSIIALNDVNLIINVICLICTFRNWRKIVFGFPICRRFGLEHTDAHLRPRRGGSHKQATSVVYNEEADFHTDNNNDFDATGSKSAFNGLV